MIRPVLAATEDEDVIAGADGIGRLLAVAEVEQTGCAPRRLLRGEHLAKDGWMDE
jgi:hypothetical protein